MDILKAPSGIRAVVAYLKSEYTSRSETALVGTDIRDPRPTKFTRVRLMGGTRQAMVLYGAMITFECWAPTDILAEDLAILTEALIWAMPDRVDACSRVVDVGGIGDQRDPDSGSPRFVFTKQIYLRSTVLT